jgi:hypothetical protein
MTSRKEFLSKHCELLSVWRLCAEMLSIHGKLKLTHRRQKPTTLRSIDLHLRVVRREQRGIFFPYTSGRQRVF